MVASARLPIKSQRFSLLISLAESLGDYDCVMAMICMSVDVRQFLPLAEAARAIEADVCHTVLVAFGENWLSYNKSPHPTHGKLHWGYEDWEEPFGLDRSTGGICTCGETTHASLWDDA